MIAPAEFTTTADLEVSAPVVSRFALDGGAMYGIVPRPVWSRVHPPDEENRVPLVARVLVVTDRASGTRVLFDAGLGQRWSDKDRARYAIERGPDLPSVLAREGIDPDTITHVMQSHLHWDHMGGLFAGEAPGTHDLAFPRAQILLSRDALAAAAKPSARSRGSFHASDVEALQRDAKIAFVDELAGAPFPFVDTITTRGHTWGLVVSMVKASATSPGIIVPTDAVPTFGHVENRWVAAFDREPGRANSDKLGLLWYATHRRALVHFYHDPAIEAASVEVGEEGERIVRASGHPPYVVRPARTSHHPG